MTLDLAASGAPGFTATAGPLEPLRRRYVVEARLRRELAQHAVWGGIAAALGRADAAKTAAAILGGFVRPADLERATEEQAKGEWAAGFGVDPDTAEGRAKIRAAADALTRSRQERQAAGGRR